MPPAVRSIDIGNSVAAYYAAAAATSVPETIYVSGQPPSTTDGTVPSDYASQVHLVLLNLHRVIIAAQAAVTDIIKLTLYIVNYDAQNRLHARPLQKFLGQHRPAVTLIPVQKLAFDSWLIEVEAILAKNAVPPQIPRSLNTAPESVDVVVIGAGLAGLMAAREIVQAGYSCIILEARDRVGGRTYTQSLANGGVTDLGAAWINDTNQSRMIALARGLNLELIEQNTTGNVVIQDFDGSNKPFPYGELPPFDDATKAHLAYIRDTVEADCQNLSAADPKSTRLDSLTFAAYLATLDASPLALSTARIWTRAMVGQEPEDISALFFLNYCKCGGGLLQMRSDRQGGGQHLRIRSGTQSFSKGLASLLPPSTLRLSSPVQSITQLAPQRVQITTTSNSTNTQLLARKVITSIPPPALLHVSFHPALPPRKRLLLESFRYGYYQKVMIVFSTPFWTQSQHCGLIQSFIGPAAVVRDTSTSSSTNSTSSSSFSSSSSSPPQNHNHTHHHNHNHNHNHDDDDGKDKDKNKDKGKDQNHHHHILTFFLAGDAGRAWSQLPTPHDREEALLHQAADAFCDGDVDKVRNEVVQVVGFEWGHEHWNGYGCPSPGLPPGVWDAVGEEAENDGGGGGRHGGVGGAAVLAQRFGDDVHFVGTETSEVWRGYMEGAVRSGERGAREVLLELRGGSVSTVREKEK